MSTPAKNSLPVQPAAGAEHGVRTCAYCHLPVPRSRTPADEAVYCCIGCRLAAEITGQSGQRGEMHWTLARLGLAIFLSLNVMMFTMALWTRDLYDAGAVGSGPLAASLADLFRYLCLVLSLPVLYLLGGPILESALSDWRRGGADLLIVVGVAAAFVYSAISVWRGAGHVYFEVGCAVLVMVTLGRWLEAQGKLKTTEALDALEQLLPKQARLLGVNGQETLVPLGDVKVGDRVRALAGERIGTDGRILAGEALVDEQDLTGESAPVGKSPGDSLLGGSLNLDGDLLIEVTATAAHSSLARVVELVREARLAKGRYERLADRVARGFLPLVVAISLAAGAWHTYHDSLDQGLLAGLAVLLIACPCALGLATPMAVWTALGTAARAGVLFRDGESLERLAEIRAVRFDKTGTLTTGNPQVRRLVVADQRSRDEVLARALSLAGGSTHGFSAAIVRFASARLAEHSPAVCAAPSRLRPVVCTAPGQGLLAQWAADESPTRLGSLRWLERTGHAIDPALQQVVTEALVRGESLSLIGWNGRVQGVFVFSETLRCGARRALDACRNLGCDVAVLTGDHAARARAIARELNVPVDGELLPADKVAAVIAARAAHGPVAMVGDGINDAPALTAGDLGIAMGCGADVSREMAGVCLVSNDLARVPWALDLARRTLRTIRQNLFWAFAYNTIGVGLAAAGWLNPAFAAAAMVGSSLLVVSNSLRLAGGPPGRIAATAAGPPDADEPAVDARLPQEVVPCST
ncbi:MAG: heavy metal translocating P-type ATPase [Pirellulales bacterium]